MELFEAKKVAGSATYKQSKQYDVVLYCQFVYSDMKTKSSVTEELRLPARL